MNYERTGKTWEPRGRYGYSLDGGRGVTPCAFWKKLAVLAAIVVVYFAVQLTISWPSVKWMVKGGKVEELKGGKVCGTFQLFNVQLFNFPKGGAS